MPAMAMALLLVACGSTKPALENKPRTVHSPSTAELVDRLSMESSLRPTRMSAKADVTLDAGKGSRSFKAHLRMVSDSAIWISVTPALGIEVARALLTMDSLLVLDKINDQYWTGSIDQAQERFGVRPELELLQEAIMGMPIGLDTAERYRSAREEGMYTLSSKERRKFIRAA